MNIKEARHAKNAAQKTRRTTRVLAQEFAHITIKKALTALYSGGNFRGVGLGADMWQSGGALSALYSRDIIKRGGLK